MKTGTDLDKTFDPLHEIGAGTARDKFGNTPDITDRRLHLRQSVLFAYLELSESNGGIVLNISEGGLAVQAVGTIVDTHVSQIRFQLPQSADWLESSGRIAWTSASKKTAGVEFLDLSGEARAQIRDWISLASLERDPEKAIHKPEKGHLVHTRTASIGTEGDQFNKPTDILENRNDPGLPADTSIVRSETRKSTSRNLYRLLAFSVLVAVLTVCFELARWTENYFFTKPGSAAESHMGLKLERVGSDFRLSWNPDAPVISKATNGRLLITDGSLHKSLDLDSSDLRSGIILYTPQNKDVVLRLEVDQADSTTMTSEAVRVAGAGPSSVASQTLKSASNHDESNPTPLPSSVPPSSGGSRGPVHVSETPKSVVSAPPAAKVAKPAQITETKVIATSEELQIAPKLPVASSPTPVQTPRIGDSTPAPPIPEPGLTSRPAPVELPSSVLPAETIQPGGHLEAPQLILRKDPIYPAAAKQAHFSGSVELHFLIAADGTVHDVKSVKGNAVLATAAIEAVQGWRYKPARLNGAPIETDGSVTLDFKY
jgi:TonB family protein